MGGNRKIDFKKLKEKSNNNKGFKEQEILEEPITRLREFNKFATHIRKLLGVLKGSNEKVKVKELEYYTENISYLHIIVKTLELFDNSNNKKEDENLSEMLKLVVSLSNIETTKKQSEISSYARKVVKNGLEKLFKRNNLTEAEKIELHETFERVLSNLKKLEGAARVLEEWQEYETTHKGKDESLIKNQNLIFSILHLLRFEAKYNGERMKEIFGEMRDNNIYYISDGMSLLSKTKSEENTRKFLQYEATREEILSYLEILEEIKRRGEQKLKKDSEGEWGKPTWMHLGSLILLKNKIINTENRIKEIKEVLKS